MVDRTISPAEVVAAMGRVAEALLARADYLTTLDQAMGDGDLGITATKIAEALKAYVAATPPDDLGKFIMGAGMRINSAAPSSLGTLLATAVMRAGKEAKDKSELDGQVLVAMLHAADQGIQERGKASPGDKTIIDAVHPAAEAFEAALSTGATLEEAGAKLIAAAEAGMEAVRPLRSKVGRAGWVGERTEGQIDPGCAAAVVIFKSIAGQEP
ncbi:MAG: dihydroxyacetone kinase subunit DhaL [Anaerolineae bacterium]